MLSELTCAIIDDEPKSVELLKQRLNILFPNINVAGTCTAWQDGMDLLRKTGVDFIFLDISMPEKSGIDFLKLFPDRDFDVIFTTAHAEYAIDAIRLSAIGYVLKPIDDTELVIAVKKVIEKRNNTHSAKNNDENTDNKTLKIGVPNVKGIDYITPSDVLYFESVNKYTKVVTKDYSIVSSYNIGEFKKIIDSKMFFQVHRSYVINMEHVKRYETSGTVVMDDDMHIPVSRNSKAEFLKTFDILVRTAGIKKKD